MHGRLHEIQLSADDQSFQIRELISRAAHLEDDLRLAARRRSSHADPPQTDEALEPLKQELLERLQQGDELETTLRETQRTLRAAEQQLQDRWRLVEELNKELRQCNLQQFIQQAAAPHTDQANLLPGNQLYLQNAGIME